MNFLFRACSDEWRGHFCPNLIIDYAEFRSTLLAYAVDASALRVGQAEWGFRKALRLKSLLVVTGGDGKDQALAAALRGEFDTYNYSKLSILSFLPAGASKAGMWAKGVRSEDALAAIASSLRNHDTWLQVVSCEGYEGASADLATSLTQDVDVWSATDNVLVLFIVMHMIAAFYNELRKNKNSVTFPEVLATTGGETAGLFKKFVGRLLVGAKAQDATMNFTPHPHNVFYDEVRGAFHHMQLSKPGGGEEPATTVPHVGLTRSARKRGAKVAKAAAASAALASMPGGGGGGVGAGAGAGAAAGAGGGGGGGQGGVVQGQRKKCKAHLCFLAKVKNGQGQIARACFHGVHCKFEHPTGDLRGYSQADALDCAGVQSRDTRPDQGTGRGRRKLARPNPGIAGAQGAGEMGDEGEAGRLEASGEPWAARPADQEGKGPGVAWSRGSAGGVGMTPTDDLVDSADLEDLSSAIEDWDLQTCNLSGWSLTSEEMGVERAPPEPPPVGGMAGERAHLSPEQKRSVAHIAATAKAFFPERSGEDDLKAMEAVALRAFKRADLDYNIEDAVREAGGFHMREESCARDCAEFDRLPVDGQGMVDIGMMVTSRKSRLAPNRLSRARVEKSLSRDNPQYNKVMALAEGGIRVRELLPHAFIPAGPEREKWARQRPKFLKASAAVEVLLQENFVDKGLAIVLDAERAQKIKGLSVHPSGWAPKAKKPLGRNTGDPVEMNTQFTKEGADRVWGKISHPSIEDFVHMVLDYAERNNIKWEDLVLVKMDITGAYTLLFISTEDVALFGTEVTRDKVVIYLCGFFGWCGTPAHFHPVTLALQWEIQKKIKGAAMLYVDDIILATTRQHEASDTRIAGGVVEGVLGEGSLAMEKKERGRRIDAIGYSMDLDQRLLTINERCVERAVGGFMAVDVEKPVPVRTMQCLASWASRYAKVCVYMAPFVRMLNNAHRGRHQHASVRLCTAAKIAVWVMRALLMLTVVDERAFARSFDTWEHFGDEVVIPRFDASLVGIGVLFYLRRANGAESLLGGAALDIRHLKFGVDSGYQNVAEFLAIIVAIWGVRELGSQGLTVNGRAPRRIALEGDSVSALAWAEKGRVKSDLATNAAIVFVLLGVATEIQVVWGKHVDARSNGRTDHMSRIGEGDKDWAGLFRKYPDLSGMKVLNLEVEELLQLARPGSQTESGVAAGTAVAVQGDINVGGLSAQQIARKVEGVEGRILHVVLFVTWMLDEKGMDSAAAWAMTSQLRHFLQIRGFQNTGFMDEDLMAKARKAGVRSVEEAYECMRLKEEREFMPAAPEMLGWVQRGYWDEASWETTEGLDRRMVALAGWLMTDSGLRISNTAAPDGPLAEDHALRAEQVVALVRERRGGDVRSIEAGNGLKEFLLQGAYQGRKVFHLQIKIRTTKTVRKVKVVKTNVLDYRRETVDESKFIDAILEWVKRSTCLEAKEMFFRRRHVRIGSILHLTSKMVATAMKLAAEQFGLDPKRFSTCSFRKHYVSMAQATGTGAAERNRRGGWATGSTVPDTNYYTGETVGLLGRRGGAGSRVSIPSVDMLYRR
ncbi:hypothetical protein B484DRAFT_400865, partial [Ochromonadaceae sp. CCMP2298]